MSLTLTLPAVHVRGRTVSQLVIWCPHCRSGHWHGGGDAFGEGDGHRVAHCHNRSSPWLETGYDLRREAEQLLALGMTVPDAAEAIDLTPQALADLLDLILSQSPEVTR